MARSRPAPFDFDGEHVQLTGAFGNPKPVLRPPILIGGRATAALRVVAKHADAIWNIPGGDIAEAVDAGFSHVVLILSAPFPSGVARWVADELISA